MAPGRATDPDSRGIGTVRFPRLVPKDADCAQKLQKRTLTNLYNERPTWLALAHQKLDAAVAAAYGWPVDLADEEILARLLALNLERAVRRALPREPRLFCLQARGASQAGRNLIPESSGPPRIC